MYRSFVKKQQVTVITFEKSILTALGRKIEKTHRESFRQGVGVMESE